MSAKEILLLSVFTFILQNGLVTNWILTSQLSSLGLALVYGTAPLLGGFIVLGLVYGEKRGGEENAPSGTAQRWANRFTASIWLGGLISFGFFFLANCLGVVRVLNWSSLTSEVAIISPETLLIMLLGIPIAFCVFVPVSF